MEIKAKTFKDKIYDHLSYIIFSIFGVIVLSIASWYTYANYQKRISIAQKKIHNYNLHLSSKLKIIKGSSKPQLVCKKSIILFPENYDLIKIKNKYFIVTEDTIKNPEKALSIDDCEIYNHLTASMKPKPKIVIPIDKQHKMQVEKLNNKIGSLQTKVSEYMNQETNYIKTLDKANKQLETLKKLIKKQDKELKRLSLVEAKYHDVKSLLTIVLEKKNISLKSLVVKETKPKPVKIKIDKIMKNSKPLKVQTDLPHAIKIATVGEYVKRQIYVIKSIRNLNNSKFYIKRPTDKDLKEINITSNMSVDLEQVKTQLNLVLTNTIKLYAMRFKLDIQNIKKTIKEKVGV